MTKQSITDVLNEHANAEIPDGPVPWSQIKNRAQAKRLSRRQGERGLLGSLRAGALVAAPVAIAMAVLAFFLWPATEARPVSAAEILAKVEGVENGSIKTGLQTAHLTESWFMNAIDVLDTEDGFKMVNLGRIEGTGETWYRAPGDVSKTGTSVDYNGVTASSTIVETPAERYVPHASFLWIMGQSKDYPQVFSQVSLDRVKVLETGYGGWDDVYTVTVVGVDEAFGRPAYLIQKDLKPEFVAAHTVTTPMWKIQVWIDQQYFVRLKSRTWMQDGSLFEQRDVTKLEFNVPVDAKLFEVNKAEGHMVADQRPVTEAQLGQSWQDARASMSVTLYAPQAGESLTAECGNLTYNQRGAYYDVDLGIVSQALMREHGNRGEHMPAIIVQGPIEVMSRVVDESTMGAPDRNVNIGSAEGRMYLSKVESAKESILVMDMGQTRIAIYSWSGDEDLNSRALKAIADSLEPVTARK